MHESVHQRTTYLGLSPVASRLAGLSFCLLQCWEGDKTVGVLASASGALFEYEAPAALRLQTDDGGQNDGRGCYCFALRNHPPAFQAFPSRKRHVAHHIIPVAEWVSQAANLCWPSR